MLVIARVEDWRALGDEPRPAEAAGNRLSAGLPQVRDVVAAARSARAELDRPCASTEACAHAKLGAVFQPRPAADRTSHGLLILQLNSS